MLHFLDILRLRGVSVSLALEEEFFNTLSPEERMLLAPHIHGNVGCVILPDVHFSPTVHLAASIESNGTLYRWARYDGNDHFLLLHGCTPGNLDARKILTQQDLLPISSHSDIIQLKQLESNEKLTITEFGPWFWGKLQQHLSKNLSNDFLAYRQPIKNINFSDRYCNSPLTIALLHSMLRHLRDYYGNAWAIPSCSVILANTINSDGFYIWNNWRNPDARDAALRSLLQDMVKVTVSSMDKIMMPHARSLRLDFYDDTALQIWLDQGLGFLRVAYGNAERQFPFRGTLDEQVQTLKTLHQTLEIVHGGTVISLKICRE